MEKKRSDKDAQSQSQQSQKRQRGRPRQHHKESMLQTEQVAGGMERLTQQILMVLMTNDPLDFGDLLFSTRTHYTAEVVHGVLDVLIVMGLVVKLTLQDDTVAEDADKKRGKLTYYALRGPCRSPEGIDIRKLSQALDEKRAMVGALEERVQALDQLNKEAAEPKDKVLSLKTMLHKAASRNAGLNSDPLYIAVCNAPGHSLPSS
jgi:hypothetical protein